MTYKKILSTVFTVFLLVGFLFSQNENAPKNIIIMIGDGMGFQHIKASEYFRGDTKSEFWSQFPVQLSASTFPAKLKNEENAGYNPDLAWKSMGYVMSGYTESAAAGTALSTGFKTKNDYIGIDINQTPLLNLTQLAKYHKKSAGIVTSVPFSHATPAAFGAHNITRKNYGEIAFEMLVQSQLDVIMGAGHPLYSNDAGMKDKDDYKYVMSRDLFSQIIDGKNEVIINNVSYSLQDVDFDKTPDSWHFSDNRDDIKRFAKGENLPKRLFSLATVFETLTYGRSGESKFPFDIEINKSITQLDEMSLAALQILNQNPEGFFLMIEGGAIDWAGHDNNLVRLIEEQILFENAVQAVIDWLNIKDLWSETLLIVVADHETGYLMGDWSSELGFVEITDKGKSVLPNATFFSEDHTNHLVPFFAKGKSADVFKYFAKNYDPRRNYFLDITDIALFTKLVWPANLVVYPEILSSNKDSAQTIYVASPEPGLSFEWYKNGILIPNENSFKLEIVVNDGDEYFVKAKNNKMTYQSNKVAVNPLVDVKDSEPQPERRFRRCCIHDYK